MFCGVGPMVAAECAFGSDSDGVGCRVGVDVVPGMGWEPSVACGSGAGLETRLGSAQDFMGCGCVLG